MELERSISINNRFEYTVLGYKNCFNEEIGKYKSPIEIAKKRFYLPLADFTDKETYKECVDYITSTLFNLPMMSIHGIGSISHVIGDKIQLHEIHESKNPVISKLYMGSVIIDSKKRTLLFKHKDGYYTFLQKPVMFNYQCYSCKMSQKLMYESYVHLNESIQMELESNKDDTLDPIKIEIINYCSNHYSFVDKTLFLTVFLTSDFDNHEIKSLIKDLEVQIVTIEELRSIASLVPVGNPWIEYFAHSFMEI